ncbi:bZIP transcription factor 23-like [Phragmites australis]|uniref:bZIP transcription factor 23-like n=1 Tax=Phragmites australis TaxID=29695 RepID=UPI002D77250C|nr:bZIP transcription factor 23-like [Phragmites australis]
MDCLGGSGRRRQQEPEQLPPMTPLPLARQGSVYSLTFDEFQSTLGGAGKDFGSMNMDELLRSIWTAEESHSVANATTSAAAAAAPIQRQGSLTLPRTLSQKTVDEVWRNMMCFGAHSDAPAAAPPPPAQRQPTLGEITLEEFLVRAGVVREDMTAGPLVPPAPASAPPPTLPPQLPMLFPHGDVFAPLVPPPYLGNGFVTGAAGQAGGAAASVVSPVGPVTSNGFGKMEGGDLSSLSPSPVPYVFNGGMRGRKASAIEKVSERRQRRMIKNRESAAKSRQRKQAYMMELEAEVAKLKELNEELHKKQVEMLEKQNNEVLERMTRQIGPTAKRICLRRTLTGPW